jgi:hypothetical protein
VWNVSLKEIEILLAYTQSSRTVLSYSRVKGRGGRDTHTPISIRGDREGLLIPSEDRLLRPVSGQDSQGGGEGET